MRKRNQFLLLAALATCSVNFSDAVSAPVQWPSSSGGNDHWYEVISVPGGISWTDARDAAELSGGYLATITSQEENNFVYALVDDDLYWNHLFTVDNNGPWIGGFHEAVGIPTEWKWVTGEAFAYSNWQANEPDYMVSIGQTQNALLFYAKGPSIADREPTWGDDWMANLNEISYVVETVPEPNTIILLATGLVGLFIYGRRQSRGRTSTIS